MKYTISLKSNRDFQRLYRRGKSVARPNLVVYASRNRLGRNRLGLTVSTKVGHAVVRNKVRRRIREAYRIHEGQFRQGYDLVVVARVRAASSAYRYLERDLLRAAEQLKLLAVPQETEADP
ncbi:MAG: ribonuclease P protein component [Clostridiales bacterium]|nr:ribonuclease P protein component [Clostridiales bacterium]